MLLRHIYYTVIDGDECEPRTYTLPDINFAVQFYKGEWVMVCKEAAWPATTPEQLAAIAYHKASNKQKAQQ